VNLNQPLHSVVRCSIAYRNITLKKWLFLKPTNGETISDL